MFTTGSTVFQTCVDGVYEDSLRVWTKCQCFQELPKPTSKYFDITNNPNSIIARIVLK